MAYAYVNHFDKLTLYVPLYFDVRGNMELPL